MAVTEELGAALGLTAEPTPPEPPEAPATYKAGQALFDATNAPPPVNAGKCAGDTDPNALQQAPLIEWIHFGYIHLSRANLFKHPTYPGAQGAGGTPKTEQSPGEPKGELFQNPLFRKQAKKNKADWIQQIDPDPEGSGGAPPEEPPEESPSEEPPEPSDSGVEPAGDGTGEPEKSGPAGQAVLMRDALLRESLALRGFLDSTLRVHRDWKKSGPLGAVGAALGGLFGPKPPDALCLKRVKNKVAKAAGKINTETATYIDTHEAGLVLNRARFQYRQYCEEELKPYFGKPSSMNFLARLLFNTLNKISSDVGTFFHLTSNVDDNFYAVYVGLCEAFEPVIEYHCDQFSVETVKAFGDSPYDIWFKSDGKSPPGRRCLDAIFEALGPSEPPAPDADEAEASSEDQTQSSEAEDEPANSAIASLPTPAPPPEAAAASQVVIETLQDLLGRDKLPRPFPKWFTVWVNHDVKTLKKLYVKLLEQTDDDRAVKIDEEFVRNTFDVDWMAKLLKTADCLFQVLKICYETYEAASASYQKLTAAGTSQSKAAEIREEGRKKLADYRQKHGLPPEGTGPAALIPPATAGVPAGAAEAVANPPEDGGDQAAPPDPLQEAQRAQQEQAQMKIDLDTLKKLDEEEERLAQEAKAEEEDQKQVDARKDVATKIDAMWKEVKTIAEGIGQKTITTIATTLEEARNEAKTADALTMEVYLSRLPYLMAVLVGDTTLKVWKDTIGKVFMAAVRTGVSLASKKDDGSTDVVGKAKQGATATGALAKSIVSLAVTRKSPFVETGFPPAERVKSCEGAEIAKADRRRAAAQVHKPVPGVFLKVEA